MYAFFLIILNAIVTVLIVLPFLVMADESQYDLAVRSRVKTRVCACLKDSVISPATVTAWNTMAEPAKSVSKTKSIEMNRVVYLSIVVVTSYRNAAHQELDKTVVENDASRLHQSSVAVEDCQQHSVPPQGRHALRLSE